MDLDLIPCEVVQAARSFPEIERTPGPLASVVGQSTRRVTRAEQDGGERERRIAVAAG
jgi:hypothetical protein